MKRKIQIFFPILTDYEEKYPFEQREIVLDEIQKILKEISFDDKYDKFITKFDIEIAIVKKAPNELVQNPDRPVLSGFREDALMFSMNVDVDLNLLIVTDGKDERVTKKKELITFLPYSLCDRLGNKIFEILVLSQIARPGSLKLREGVIWINKKRQSDIIPKITNLRESFEFTRDYPQIEFINFYEYYFWLYKNDLIFNESPKNSYQKAVNNFSHLNGNSNTVTCLIYQMMTLELLYTNGINQISDQLNTKIQIYLGEMNSYKKQIKKMYDIRSRFLHGDLPIFPMHKEDYIDSLPAFEYELEDARHLSIFLIISTLQKMYKDNLLDLNFKYTLTTHNSG